MPKKKAAVPAKTAVAPKTKVLAKKKPLENKKLVKKTKKQSQEQQSPEEMQEKQEQDSEGRENEQSASDSNENSNEDDDEDDDDDEGSEDDDSQSQSSITPVKPENYAVKQMQFRERRGTKMNYLMTRKKEQEEDPFWAEHKGLFGDLNAQDDEDDEEDYVQSSSGKDQFDSDFGQTQSQHDQPQQDEKKMVEELDEQKEKQKKRRAELMKKVNAYKEKPDKGQKLQKSQKLDRSKAQVKTETVKKPKCEQKMQEQVGNRFIHQVFTQQQLLGEAAHTQYYNWLSLKKLISIETEKKDFTRKIKHVDGNKVIYKNRLGENGTAATSYELCGVSVSEVKDLTNYWLAK